MAEHGRCIDADALMKDICDSIDEATRIGILVDGEYLWAKLNDAIEHAPTIEPERKKGEWLHVDQEPEVMLGWMPWYCSECGVGIGKHQTSFCPHCGADMRGEEND